MTRFRLAFAILITLAVLGAAGPARADDENVPSKKIFHLKDLGGTPSQEPVAVAGVRGLDKSKESGDTSARDYAALKKLEAVMVTPEELKQFLKEGKLP